MIYDKKQSTTRTKWAIYLARYMIELDGGRVSCPPTVRTYMYTHLKCSDIIGSVDHDQNSCAGACTVRFHSGFLERGWQALHGIIGFMHLKGTFQVSIERKHSCFTRAPA